jgi:hypothetical protein
MLPTRDGCSWGELSSGKEEAATLNEPDCIRSEALTAKDLHSISRSALLDGEIGGLRSVEDLVDETRSLAGQLGERQLQ